MAARRSVSRSAERLSRVSWALIVATLLLHGLPLACYAYASETGALPSPAVWDAQGGNHGPWYELPIGEWLVYMSLLQLALPFATLLIAGIALALTRRSQDFLLGLCLFAIQFVLVPTSLFVWFWTID